MAHEIRSLANVTRGEATSYLADAQNDELQAAIAIAVDRIKLSGSNDAPDDVEIHHALFLLRRARGLAAPSFDAMRVELRTLLAA